MNLDSFVVRPQRKWVETYVDPLAWHSLAPQAAGDIGEHLSGLPSSVRDDEQAKRFDLLMLRLQLTRLTREPGFDRLRTQGQLVAAALLDQRNIRADQVGRLVGVLEHMRSMAAPDVA